MIIGNPEYYDGWSNMYYLGQIYCCLNEMLPCWRVWHTSVVFLGNTPIVRNSEIDNIIGIVVDPYYQMSNDISDFNPDPWLLARMLFHYKGQFVSLIEKVGNYKQNWHNEKLREAFVCKGIIRDCFDIEKTARVEPLREHNDIILIKELEEEKKVLKRLVNLKLKRNANKNKISNLQSEIKNLLGQL